MKSSHINCSKISSRSTTCTKNTKLNSTPAGPFSSPRLQSKLTKLSEPSKASRPSQFRAKTKLMKSTKNKPCRLVKCAPFSSRPTFLTSTKLITMPLTSSSSKNKLLWTCVSSDCLICASSSKSKTSKFNSFYCSKSSKKANWNNWIY